MAPQELEQKENVRIISFLASSIHRKNRLGKFVEKGGGEDGSYATSRVELRIPEGSIPFVVVYYGPKPTIVAAVNTIEARSHNENEETVFILLKNHVGWTKGMTRLHRFTFVDDIEADIIVEHYNLLAATVGRKEDADEHALIAMLEDANLEEESAGQDEGKEVASTSEAVVGENTNKEENESVKQNKDCVEEVLVEGECTEESSEDEDSIDMPHLEEKSTFDEDEEDSFGPMTQEDFPDGEFTTSY